MIIANIAAFFPVSGLSLKSSYKSSSYNSASVTLSFLVALYGSLSLLLGMGNNISGFQPHKQDPKYRERLDPTLRKSVLSRDNNTCQICEMISGMEFVEVLDVHHIQEVYLGGSDDINNLITACTVCHKLIHLHGRGELYMRPLDELSESEQRRFKRIIKLGNKIRMDMKMKGMKVDQLKKMDNTETIGRTKPGTGQTAG